VLWVTWCSLGMRCISSVARLLSPNTNISIVRYL
jgi:hypothetical protein